MAIITKYFDVFKPFLVWEGEETFESKPPASAVRRISVCEGDWIYLPKPCLVCEGEEASVTVNKANEGAHTAAKRVTSSIKMIQYPNRATTITAINYHASPASIVAIK